MYQKTNQNQFLLPHQCCTHFTNHLSLSPVQKLRPLRNNTQCFFYNSVSLSHFNAHTHTRTFIPSTVGDIYSDYVGPWRSKIVVIRKLARHLSLQQPIIAPGSTGSQREKLHTEMIPTGLCVRTFVLLSFWGQVSDVWTLRGGNSSVCNLIKIRQRRQKLETLTITRG